MFFRFVVKELVSQTSRDRPHSQALVVIDDEEEGRQEGHLSEEEETKSETLVF
jgi:hypothetical protein